MKGTFLRTSASRIATPLFCKIQGGLNKGFYLSEAIQSPFSLLIGHQKACHINKYTYLYNYVKKKVRIVKEFFPFDRLDKKSRTGADPERENYSAFTAGRTRMRFSTHPSSLLSPSVPHGVNFASPATLSIQTGPKYESNLG